MIYYCWSCGEPVDKPMKIDGYREYIHLLCYELENIGEE